MEIICSSVYDNALGISEDLSLQELLSMLCGTAGFGCPLVSGEELL